MPDDNAAILSQNVSQNARHDALPDFRNLGVIARTLLAVNFAAAAVAATDARSLGHFAAQATELAALVEPALLASLIVLYAASPLLARIPYYAGVAFVFATAALSAGAAQSVFGAYATNYDPARMTRTLGFALAVALVLLGYFRLRGLAYSPALAEARLQALQARIRPHFLFNSLNAVLALIRTDARQAESALENLAELYRRLMADNRGLTRLADEIELTREYLNLEHLRLGERLRVNWRIDESALDAQVPALMLQPLVENAVYHGVEPGAGPGAIDIEIARDGDRLQLQLTNPFHPEYQYRQGNRMALANIRERLMLHFDVEASLATEIVDGAFVTRIALPCRPAA